MHIFIHLLEVDVNFIFKPKFKYLNLFYNGYISFANSVYI